MLADITIAVRHPTPRLGISPESCHERLASALSARELAGVKTELICDRPPLAYVRVIADNPGGWTDDQQNEIWDALSGELVRLLVELLHHACVASRFRPSGLEESRRRSQIEARTRQLLRQPAHDAQLRAEVRTQLESLLDEVCLQGSGSLRLSLEGFIRFRLKACVAVIDKILGQSRGQLARESERGELMQLLSQIVQEEAPGPRYLDVVRSIGGRYRLLDAEGRPVETEYLAGDVFELVESDSDRLDLLFSALITIMPGSFTCHFECQPLVKSQFRQLFGKRVTFCDGCALCREQPLGLTLGTAGDQIRPSRGR